MFFQFLNSMKTAINKLSILFFFSVTIFMATAQEKESDKLKRQQEELNSKIAFTEKLLESTEDSKANLSSSISLISNKIKYREALLNNISVQLKTLNSDVKSISKELEILDAQLKNLEQQYKNMIVQAYKMRSESASVFFIISSTNFNQATKRLAYLNQLTKFRADQIQRIKLLRQTIASKKTEIEQKKIDQEKLLKNKEQEKSNYLKDRENKQSAVKELEGKELQLQSDLQAQKRKSDQIKRAISAAIRKEIEEARKKEKAKPKTLAETKEIAINNTGFENNKGRLPWPVSKGEVTKA